MEGETEKREKGVRIQTLNYAMVMAFVCSSYLCYTPSFHKI